MNDINNLFFELIRVAIGAQESLSRMPSESEWKELYEMAKKQSLVGICFAGVQKMCDSDEEFYFGMSEMQYLVWMGMAANIQRLNEVVNKQCVELQERLAATGFRSCVLKGQSAAALYRGSSNGSMSSNDGTSGTVETFDLRALRQSGDIDIWVDAPRKEIIAMVQKIAPTTNVREHHLELQAFHDTEVEVHFWPAVIRHFLKNRKLQKWFDTKRETVFALGTPTPEFHAIQMMAHMYHHLFDSGIGLRQVMDYYMVLRTLSSKGSNVPGSKGSRMQEVSSAIDHIGMGRFASAMMWVIKTIFVGHENECENEQLFPWKPNNEDGKFFLGEIMRGGNFGHHDDRKNLRKGGYLNSFLGGIVRNFRYLRFNPFDWFWSPLWRLYYFGWRRVNGYK